MGIFNYLFEWKKWNIKKGDLVLELGSGGSPMVRSNVLVDKYIHDDSERELNITKDRPLICADIVDLPFKENIFDFVYASHVLEHLDEVENSLNEITRVGKRGLIIVPGEIFERAWDKHPHKWIITVVENQIIFREKCYCTRLNQNDILGKWRDIFWKIYTKNKKLLDINYFWKDIIPFKIIRCKNGGFKRESQAHSERNTKRKIIFKYRIKIRFRTFLSKIIRSFYA
ncbi:MAG: class I SAM-dependent methyltransferase [Candidatus Aminicenantaceae bacterium]